MNKSKIIFSIVIVVCIIGLVIFNATYTKVIPIEADRVILANNFEQLEEESDLIIKAKILPNKENKLDKTDNGVVLFGYTVSKLLVEEIYYGEALKNDIIYITEEYYTINQGLGKNLFVQGNYIPAKENQEYIFFLKKYGDSTRYKGMYFPIDLEQGKYLVSDKTNNSDKIDDSSNKELEIGSNPDEKYRNWFKKVIDKYYIR